MTAALLGQKLGMTRIYDESGSSIPVTVIKAGPCFVSQMKTVEKDGYEAVQLAYMDVKGRHSTIPLMGHDAASGLSPKRFHREFPASGGDVATLASGQQLSIEVFDGVSYVDVSGISKGKGFSGVIKRWGFKGQGASHGVERKHRSPGSIGGRSSNLGTGKPKKGIRMSGQHGNARMTVRSLKVVGRDVEKNLILVKGPVPGANQGLLLIRKAKRLCKSKAKAAEAS